MDIDSDLELDLDNTMKNIDILINEVKELERIKLEKQQHFNTNFIIKFMVFVFFYRIYNISDPQNTIVNCIEYNLMK